MSYTAESIWGLNTLPVRQGWESGVMRTDVMWFGDVLTVTKDVSTVSQGMSSGRAP